MNKLIRASLFLLAVAMLSGCMTPAGETEEEDREKFEAARRCESNGDIGIAREMYGELDKRGSFYAEYGHAMLLLHWDSDSGEAMKHLLSCAHRTMDKHEMFPVSVAETAFAIAAMAKLSDIAKKSEHDNSDVDKWFRNEMFRASASTPEVEKWAAEKKANADSAKIYDAVISAVESVPRNPEKYVKTFKWPEICKVFIDESGNSGSETGGDSIINSGSKTGGYSVVKFKKKAPDATFQYDFEVLLTGNSTFDVPAKVRAAIRREVVSAVRDANPKIDLDDIGILCPIWDHSGSTIKGTVVGKVMKMKVVRREYNDATGFGKIVVEFDNKDVDAATKLAKENIENLATRKNIMITVGREPPKNARYKTYNEHAKDGRLEIIFKCE